MAPERLLDRRRALVTGAGTGIGRAIARALAARRRAGRGHRPGWRRRPRRSPARSTASRSPIASTSPMPRRPRPGGRARRGRTGRARDRLRQCRRLDHEPCGRPLRGRVGPQHGGQRQGRVPHQPGGGAPLAGGRHAGRDRQHRLARRQAGRAAAGALLGQQVRGRRLHPVARPRGGGARHPRELRLPGLRAHRDAGARGRLGGASCAA